MKKHDRPANSSARACNKPASTSFNMGFILFISLSSALGGLLFGYDLLVISGAKQFYELHFNLDSPVLQGWAVSSCIVGCIIGALGVGKAADRYGRVKLLMVSALLFFISAIGSGYAPSFHQFIAYRLLGGIGMGMASTLSPMYIAEISPARYRGRFVSLNQLTIVIGILLAQLINYQISEYHPVPQRIQEECALAADLQIKTAAQSNTEDNHYSQDLFTESQRQAILNEEILTDLPVEIVNTAELRSALRSSDPIPVSSIDLVALRKYTNQELKQTWNGTTGWRLMFAAEAIPAGLFFLLMFFVPPSPRWLTKQSRDDEAYGVLERIGGSAYATQTLKEIEATLDKEHKQLKASAVFQRPMSKILLVGIFIAVFQQWCGINVIFNYAPDIFRDAGFTVSGIMFSLVIIGLTNMAFTFVGMATIDRLGRKPLMLIGSAGLLISHLAIGWCYYSGNTGWYVVAFALLAVAVFAATLGPVAWVLISEIFPNAIRGVAMSIAVLSLWVANFILSFTFPILRDSLGPAGTFWTYAGICLVGILYIRSHIPETKGKSLEQIETELVS
ncbi:sugar porter family MFS transporter [Verrucomicrobiaceae bacterium N1E253]|uniref:Sugar porter family MFS transporter n=2 Tax=Oceaniferula marina TaxID=2748318 RepID=A0A851GCH5_9BACT|nr:sugar porter family MFS transporter [Oceaniferula marina]NWK55273.1 sugar porter family MFS transporter [Oceaniferula marina]